MFTWQGGPGCDEAACAGRNAGRARAKSPWAGQWAAASWQRPASL